MRNFFALALTLATSFSTVSAAPKALKAKTADKTKAPKADKTDDAFMLSCISERTGPDGGISISEAYRVCRAEVRDRTRIERAKARVVKAILACEQTITDACVEACDDTVKGCDCTEAVLAGEFQACRGY